MQEGRAHEGGRKGVEGAELARPLGGYPALCHGLKGEAEAAANQRKPQYRQPLRGAGGQLGSLEYEGGYGGEQADEADLRYAYEHGVALFGKPVSEYYRQGVKHGREYAQPFAEAEAEPAGAQGEGADAYEGKPGAEQSLFAGQLLMQQRLHQRHYDYCGIFEKGGGGGEGVLEGEKLRRHHRGESAAYRHAHEQRPEVHPLHPTEEYGAEYHEGKAEANGEYVEGAHSGEERLGQQQRGAAGNYNAREKELRRVYPAAYPCPCADAFHCFCPFLIFCRFLCLTSLYYCYILE